MENQHKQKRSSLKISTPLNESELKAIQLKGKRNSVSFQIGNSFNLQSIKPTFDESTQERKLSDFAPRIENKKKFEEKRKKSIKNEFAAARELIKNQALIEEFDKEEIDNIKKNTILNIKVGKEKNDSDSNSSISEEENKEN